LIPRRPFMIGRTSHMKQLTGCLNGIPRFCMAFFYSNVDMPLPHL
jgi:hypothetical protein